MLFSPSSPRTAAAGVAALTLTLTLARTASAKPEQIRAVQDPIFHLYLQAYPQDREFYLPLSPVLSPSFQIISAKRMEKKEAGVKKKKKQGKEKTNPEY